MKRGREANLPVHNSMIILQGDIIICNTTLRSGSRTACITVVTKEEISSDSNRITRLHNMNIWFLRRPGAPQQHKNLGEGEVKGLIEVL